MNRIVIILLLLIPGISRSQNLSFDGTNDYVSTANTSDLSGNSTASIQVWIYKTSDPAAGVILYHGSGAADGADFAYQIYEVSDSDLISFYLRTSNGATGINFDSDDISLNTWHQIVGVYDGSNLKSYLNGALKSTSGDITGSTQSINKPLHIGKQYNGSYFAGKIDEVAIWDDALSAAEITALYNSRAGLIATANSGNYTSSGNLIGYWPMNDGSGSSIADGSSNSSTGTINGASWSTSAVPTLSSSSPADNATGVGVNDNIVLTFSEAVVAGSGNILISTGSNSDGGFESIPVGNAKVSISNSELIGHKVVTINPATEAAS